MEERPASGGQTYAGRLLEATRLHANKPAIRWKEDEAWLTLTYRDVREKIILLAAALSEKGLKKGDRFAIWTDVRWEWLITDFALQILGAVMVPIYQSVSPAEARKILQDSESVGLVTNASRFESLGWSEHSLKTEFTIVLEPFRGLSLFAQMLKDGEKVLSLKQGLREKLEHPTVVPEDISAIIYTSGTTGEPKGAMQTHRNVTEGVIDTLVSHVLGFHGGPERQNQEIVLLHLPLAHIITRNILVPSVLFTGNLLALASKEKEKLLSNFAEVKPTLFVTVPYVLDKFALAILDRITMAPFSRRRFAEWALRAARRHAMKRLRDGVFEGYAYGALMRFIDRKVLRKIRDLFGGRLTKIAVGGSNSNRDHVEFFWSIGIPAYEAYGATEITNIACFTAPDGIRLGTVGKPVPGLEVKIADDGELLVRGPNVMKGYWKRPQETAQTIDAEGWYHTGDLAEQDAQGYVKIIDRKKDIFVMSTGKNVAPQLVENTIKTSQLISQVCCIGDGRKYLTALIYPDWIAVESHLGLVHAIQNPREREKDRNVEKLIHEEILHATQDLSDFEKVKKFIIVPEPFTLENGLLTPTLKMRRKNIMKRYREEIESMYT